MTKSELRAARKAARAEGKPLTGDLALVLDDGRPHYAPVRTPAEERAHSTAMCKWARAYDALNGAPENDSDR